MAGAGRTEVMRKEAIESALAAHVEWKKRLHDAISAGRSELEVEVVRRDNVCRLGQWLHSLSPPAQGPDYLQVMAIHREFHKVAAEVVALAVEGKKEAALDLLDAGGKYMDTSGRLALALNTWMEKL